MADASEPIVKCGIGLKSGRAGGESCKWKRRWFVLRQGSLSYFKSNSHHKPRCVIPMRALNACVTTGNSSLIYRVGSRELHVNMADTSDACEWAHAVRECQKIECSRLQLQSCVHLPFFPFCLSILSPWHRQQSAIKSLGFPVLLILEVVDGPYKGAMWEIGDEGCTIVRNPKGISCVHMRLLQQVQIPDPDVSRQHATIFWSHGVARLRDLGSLNGSFLNGVRLSPEKVASDPAGVEIRGGDDIIMGRSKMQVFFRVVVPEEGSAGAHKRAAAEEKRKQREQRASERKFRLQMQVQPCSLFLDSSACACQRYGFYSSFCSAQYVNITTLLLPTSSWPA